MPIVAREVHQFSISDGGEVALCGWWWFAAGADELDDLVSDITAAHSDDYWWDNAGTTEARAEYSGHTAVSGRWLEMIDMDTGVEIQRAFLPLPVNATGASAAGATPAEVAICVGVRSGFAEKSGNGRFYLPGPSVDCLTGIGNFTTAMQILLLDSLSNYFSDVHSQSQGMVLGTWSQKNLAFTPAQTINIGNVPDSQRRRRNKLVESRYNAAVN